MTATPVLRDILSDVITNVLTDIIGSTSVSDISEVPGLAHWMGADVNVAVTAGSRDFNGTTQSFSLTDPAEADFSTSDFILSGAFNRDDTGNQVLISKYQDASNFWALVFTAGDVLSFSAVVGGVVKVSVVGTTAITDTLWHTFSLSVDRDGSGIIFLDGVDDTNTESVSTDDIDNTGNLFIGQRGDSSLFFNGQLENIGIGKGSTLTAAEHAALYNSGDSIVFGGLSASTQAKYTLYYNCNESSGNLIDAIGSNDMTASASAPGISQAIAISVAADTANAAAADKLNGSVVVADPVVAWLTNTADGTPNPTADEDESGNHGLLVGHDLLTVYDQTGRGNNLTLKGFLRGTIARTNAVPTGASGSAIFFNAIDSIGAGGDEYASAGNVTDLNFATTKDFTIEGWIRIAHPVTGTPFVISKHTTGTQPGWEIAINTDGRLSFFIDDGTNSVSSTNDGTAIDDYEWHHWAIVFDRSLRAIRYVDGIADGSTDLISAVLDMSNSFDAIIGQRHDIVAGRYIDAAMANLRVYGRVLTPAEILYRKEIYIGTPTDTTDDPGTADVLAEWTFDDNPRTSGTAYVFPDDSANSNYASPIGFGIADPRSTNIAAGATGTSVPFNGAGAANQALKVLADAAIDDIFSGGGTVFAWVYLHSDGEGDNGQLLTKRTFNTSGWQLWFDGQSGGKVRMRFLQEFSTTAGNWRSTDTEVTLNTWTLVAVVYDNTDVANDPLIYVGSTAVALTELATPVGTPLSDTVDDMYIGSNDTLTTTLDGFIDEIGFYNAELSASDITYLNTFGTSGTVPSATLVGKWSLDTLLKISGTALRFGGSQRVNTGQSIFFQQSKTRLWASFWAYTGTGEYSGDNMYAMDSATADAATNDGFFFNFDDRGGVNQATNGITIAVATAVGTTRTEVYDNVVSVPTDWHHYSFAYDSVNLLRLWIDGVLQTPSTTVEAGTGDFTPRNGRLVFGGKNDGSGDHFKRALDLIEFYDQVPTNANVQYLYFNPLGLAGGTDPTTDDRIAVWGFDEDDARSVATLANGYSLSFNGTSDYEFRDDGINLSGAKAISLWLRTTSTDSHMRLVALGSGGSQFNVSINNGKLNTHDGANTIVEVTEMEDMRDGQWHHVVVSVDGTNDVKFYHNGVFVAAYTSTYVLRTLTDARAYVARDGGTPNYYDGLLDDVRVFDRSVTAAEAYDLSTGTDDTTSLIMRHAYDDGHQFAPVNDDIVVAWVSRALSGFLPQSELLDPAVTRHQYWQDDPTARALIKLDGNGINGKSAISFSGAEYIALLGGLIDLFDFTIVFKTGSSAFAADQCVYGVSYSLVADQYYSPCIIDSAGKVNVEYNGGGVNNRLRCDTTVLSLNTTYRVHTKIEDGTIKVDINGVNQSLTATIGSNQGRTNPLQANRASVGALILSTGVTKFFEGLVSEFSLFNQNLSLENEELVSSYLIDKYGV